MKTTPIFIARVKKSQYIRFSDDISLFELVLDPIDIKIVNI